MAHSEPDLVCDVTSRVSVLKSGPLREEIYFAFAMVLVPLTLVVYTRVAIHAPAFANKLEFVWFYNFE